MLAAAQRLNGKNATTTWWLCDRMLVRFPKTHWRPAESLVVDGRTVTASGASGYLPLMLDRLSGVYGAEVVRDVREVLMLPQPRIRHDAFRAVDIMTMQDAGLRKLLLFAQRTPASELNLQDAAHHLNVSVRTLCRQVQLATGLAAGDWLRRIKLGRSAKRCAAWTLPSNRSAMHLGYGSEASLHRAFKKTTGLTLAEYRRAYGK